MKGKDKGFSLVELIVVIAMMAVAVTVTSLALSNITLANAKKCATELRTALELARVETTGRVAGDAPVIRLYKDDGSIYLKAGDAGAEEIGNGSVKVQYRTESGGTLADLDDTGLQFQYKKSTGGFARMDAKEIVISGAYREYVITLYETTGKVKMD